jgi:phosphoglycerate dehydrogenase-like enzyme
MTVRIAQFVQAASDVVDEAFRRDFPEVAEAKAHSLESVANALDGADILHVYNSVFTAEFALLVRDKGRALKWIQFTTVRSEIRLKAGLAEGVWVTNSGDVSQRVLASHAMALMLGVLRGFSRFEQLRARREWARHTMSSHILDPDGRRMVILAMGHIGQDIARKAKAFDMEVICVTRIANISTLRRRSPHPWPPSP